MTFTDLGDGRTEMVLRSTIRTTDEMIVHAEAGMREGVERLAELLLMSADFRLEVVQVPVADIDRAKAFYVDQAGFNADHDTQISETVRVVQLTPAARRARS